MKKAELIIGLISIIGIILKYFHVPGGIALMALAFLTLSVFYFAFSFAIFNEVNLRDILKGLAYKNTSVKRIIGAIALGWAISVVIVGILFKIQSFPGATIQLMVGLVELGFILLIALVFYIRNKSVYYVRIFKRIAVFGLTGLFVFLLPAEKIMDFFN